MQKEEIRHVCLGYLSQSVCIMLLLTIIISLVSYFADIKGVLIPVVVSMAFYAVVEIADIVIWGKVKKCGDDGLPTFYTAVSGFRVLLGIATLVVCYLVVGRDAMLPYCLVFMCYYMSLLAHHSMFFSRQSNSHTSCDNEKK